MNAIAGFAASCALAVGACLPISAMGQDSAQTPRPLGREWVPVDPARLAGMRGGLMMPSGMVLSFGIERLVYVNGQLVASANLQIPDLGRVTADQASALAAINQGRVVQIGEGNRIDPGASGNALVIQNTLDGQAITALTTLNVGVGTLATLQEINSFDALRSALIASPGSP
jgi:hypothetical protein